MGAACRKLFSASAVQAAGSVLDRVISQASNEDNTVLYKLADYKKGGLLLETYARGGMMAAEKLMREEFSSYMYAGGRGRTINRAEYLRWKFRDQKQVVLPIEASLSPHDPLAKWEDHTACWQMSYRGALGESLLHVLIICDTKVHTRLARTLVKCFPKLSIDVVEGEEYLGASSLHLAIAYSNNELVQDLVEAGADVGQRAIGSFFLPRDQQCNPPVRQTNYEGLAYLGEYPLAWAACCANESVYNLLLDSGADPDLPDSFGNMILHMVVVCDKLDMFGYALRHPKLPASNGRVNHAGYTPLTLACHLGRDSVFREMLELSAREFWRYSNITCSGYPLNALDTLLPDGRTNWNSALFIILNGTKQEHLNMLDGGIIQRLLEEKWKTFARTKFLKRLLILMLHLLLLSLSVYLRHSSAEADVAPDWGLRVDDLRSGVRLASELGTLASTMCYIILQQGDELKNQGLVAYLKQLIHEPAKLIFLSSNVLLLLCIPARFSQQTSVEEAILIFVLPGSWFLLMFFAGAVKLTGPFVTMIYSMITGDMFTFGIIYCIVLFGFSQSFFFLYRGFPNVQSTLFSSYPTTWMALFQITLGDYSYSDLSQTTYPNLSKTVFALFMVFVPILLLNMLIAMMGNTYAHVIEQSEKEWVKQWAKIVVSLERSVAQEDAHRYLQEYSIGLGPSDDPRYEQRAVMVIKSKDKTRAKQRKGALTNWKRVGRVTIAELRRRGLSGEELRRLMWGRTSISTPTKHANKRPAPPEGSGVVGEMASSALDVMSFTHDLHVDIGVKQPTPDLLIMGRQPGTVPTSGNTLQVPSSQVLPATLSGKSTLNLPPNQRALDLQVPVGSQGQIWNGQMQVQVPQMQGQIPPVQGQMPPMQGQVTPMQGQMTPMQGQLTSMQAHIPQMQGQMSPMQGQMTQTQGTILPIQSQMTQMQSQISRMQGQMPQMQGQIQGQVPQIQCQMPQIQGQVPQMQVPMPRGQGPIPTQIQIGIQAPYIAQMPTQSHVSAGVIIGPQIVPPGVQSQVPSGVGVNQFGAVLVPGQDMLTSNLQGPGLPHHGLYEQSFRDYFLEYVVLSDKEDAKEHQLKDLITRSADLSGVPEINASDLYQCGGGGRALVAGAMSELFGVSAPAAAAGAWRRDKHEHSDSDHTECALLGRSSRARRARAALARVSAQDRPHLYVPARSMYLAASESSAVESDAPPDNTPDDVESRVRAVRPWCVSAAAGAAPLQHQLYVVGSGSGAETEGAAPAPAKKFDRKRKRPKTAKPRGNRVSPGRPASSPLQPWATQPLAEISRLMRQDSQHTDTEPSTPERY